MATCKTFFTKRTITWGKLERDLEAMSIINAAGIDKIKRCLVVLTYGNAWGTVEGFNLLLHTSPTSLTCHLQPVYCLCLFRIDVFFKDD